LWFVKLFSSFSPLNIISSLLSLRIHGVTWRKLPIYYSYPGSPSFQSSWMLKFEETLIVEGHPSSVAALHVANLWGTLRFKRINSAHTVTKAAVTLVLALPWSSLFKWGIFRVRVSKYNPNSADTVITCPIDSQILDGRSQTLRQGFVA
jgi:hypothetical protein